MAKATPSRKTAAAPAKPVIDDVEDLLNVASDERDVIWLSRMNSNNGWELLETLSPAAMREPGITVFTKQKYGGGRFRARIRQRNGPWGASRQFSIAGESVTPSTPTVAATAAPATGASREMPAWLEKIVLPVAGTLAAGIAAKILAGPQTDPLVLELLKISARAGGESVDALALQKMIADAEFRGRELGKQIGELTVSARRSSRAESGESSSGVLAAIREGAAAIKDIASARRGDTPAAPPRRTLPRPPAADRATQAEPAEHEESVNAVAAPDIVPEWLRPVMKFRPLLLLMADTAGSADTTAAHVINDVDETTWAAVVQARADGRLESDLLSAVPELGATDRRRAFVAELVELVTDAVDHPEPAGDEPGAEAEA